MFDLVPRWTHLTSNPDFAATYIVCRISDISRGSLDHPFVQAPTTPSLSQYMVIRDPVQLCPHSMHAVSTGIISIHDMLFVHAFVA